MVLSPMMGIELFFQFTFQYSDIFVSVLATILLIYGGKPFYQGAVDEFKQKEHKKNKRVNSLYCGGYFSPYKI